MRRRTDYRDFVASLYEQLTQPRPPALMNTIFRVPMLREDQDLHLRKRLPSRASRQPKEMLTVILEQISHSDDILLAGSF